MKPDKIMRRAQQKDNFRKEIARTIGEEILFLARRVDQGFALNAQHINTLFRLCLRYHNATRKLAEYERQLQELERSGE